MPRSIKDRLLLLFLIIILMVLMASYLSYRQNALTMRRVLEESMISYARTAKMIFHMTLKREEPLSSSLDEAIRRALDYLLGPMGPGGRDISRGAILFGKSGYAFVIDCNALTAFGHPFIEGAKEISSMEAQGRNVIKEMCALGEGTLSYRWKNPHELEHREKLAYVLPLEVPGRKLIIGVSLYLDDYASLFMDAATKGLRIWALFLLMLAALFLAGYLDLSRKLSALVGLMESIDLEEGTMADVPKELLGDDELSKVAKALKEVASRLVKAYEEIEAYVGQTTAMNEQLMAQQDELTGLYEALSQRTRTLTSMVEAASAVTGGMDPKSAALSIMYGLMERFGAYGAMMGVVKGDFIEMLFLGGYKSPIYEEHPKLGLTGGPRSLSAKAVLTRTIQLWDEATFDNWYMLYDPLVKSEVAVPLMHLGRVMGVMVLSFDRPWADVKVSVQALELTAPLLGSIVASAEYAGKVERLYRLLVEKLLDLSELRDYETTLHMKRMELYVRTLCDNLGIRGYLAEEIAMYAPLHDIGKLKVPPSIIKKSGPLSPEEFEEVKKHVLYGAQIIGDEPELAVAKNICLYHHENYDGSGYMGGLKGEDIPIEARLVKIIDVYDALREERPYKRAFSHEEALEIISKGDHRIRPQHFDPKVLKAFLDSEKEFNRIFEENKEE